MQLEPAMDYVIIARKSIVDASHSTLLEWMERAVAELPHA
jgi:RNase P protein component